jgi:large subunit ribosomal protein L13
VRTYTPKVHEITREWRVIDAEGLVLGRVATVAASLLRGKHRTFFAPHVDTGDFVIIINADKIVVTANKAAQNFQYHHSGYPGGLRSTSWASLLENDPEKLVFDAIKGMVPKNRLGRAQMGKLFVYAGAEHPHAAQQPTKYDTSAIRRG